MKFTVKGVCFTLLVIFSGFLLLLLPSFIMGTVKNYLIARENREVSRQEDHWVYNSTGRRFEYHDGSFIQNTSQEIDGVTYYFDEQGYVRTGWVQEKGVLYYRDSDGTPETGWFEDESGKYYLDENILNVSMNRLRKKLEDIGLVDFVQTKRGVGYFV